MQESKKKTAKPSIRERQMQFETVIFADKRFFMQENAQ